MVKTSFINVNEDVFIGESDDAPIYERANPIINAVATHRISDIAALDQKKNLLDLDVVKEHMKNEGRLSNQQMVKLHKDALSVLTKERNLLEIDRPCYVIGDTHGQYYDLLSFITELLATALENNRCILFVGDYVDRGAFSCETILFLLLLKTHYPNTIYLTRGNHESYKMTTFFTFHAECMHKYNESIYKLFLDLFNALPLAAVIQESAFCCHGGIGPNLTKISEINKIDRFVEVPYVGTFCDLLWSDPHPHFTGLATGRFEPNEQRRTSFYYSSKDVEDFLVRNGLKLIIRGHEVQEDGYKMHCDSNGTAQVVTVFSAPNYCDAYKNTGALLFYDKKIKQIEQFTAVRHPYVINGFMDGITWSFPFVMEKVLNFALDLMNCSSSLSSCSTASKSNEGVADEVEDCCNALFTNTEDFLAKEERLMKNIVMLRTERETIDELVDEDSTLDCCGLDTKRVDDLNFHEAKEQDKTNEEIIQTPELKTKPISLNLSPSLATTNFDGVLEGKEDIVVKKTEGIEEIMHYKVSTGCKKETKPKRTNKKKWCYFWC